MKKLTALIVFLNFIFICGVCNLGAAPSGLTVGVGLDYSVAIVTNTDTSISSIAANSPSSPGGASAVNKKFIATVFNPEKDYGYGGQISFGFMSDNGVGAEFEFGFFQNKNTEKNNQDSYMQPSMFTGMINGQYLFDLGLIFYPFIALGAGVSRVNIKGNIYDEKDTLLTFDNLKKNALVYQAGAGVMFGSCTMNFGLQYKFLSTMNVDRDGNFDSLTVNLPSSTAGVGEVAIDPSLFNWKSIASKNHLLVLIAKFSV